jgi:type I restriction enzyme S subunit
MNMRDHLKPYAAYKDSGLPWLGDIPVNWTVKRGKGLFNCVDIRSSTGDEELLTALSHFKWVTRPCYSQVSL